MQKNFADYRERTSSEAIEYINSFRGVHAVWHTRLFKILPEGGLIIWGWVIRM